MLTEFGIIFIAQLLSLVVGAGLVLLLAVIYDAAYRSMSWFTSTWLMFGLYMCPLFFGLGLGPAIYLIVYKRRVKKTLQKEANFEEMAILKQSYQIQLFLHAQCIIYIFLLILLTALGIRSGFLILIAIIFYGITTFINFFSKLQLRGIVHK